jgi:signal transduction histidine kinase/ActR/RegA family two-component response regulator
VNLVAEAAIDTLLSQINERVTAPRTISVRTSLVERESCGCTPTYSGETSEQERRSIAKRIVEHREVASAVGAFASKLLAVTQLDMSELGRILGETLTEVGIARPLLGVYEPSGDDPVAGSIIEPGDGLEGIRFATRTFPPVALAPPEPFRMMVMPLRLHDEFGFIALASDDLASCVAIAYQSEAAFESARNIMVRERAEASLADTEERLRQAQRMEAIGQLAGGIAHDFNNLLTPIVGCASLIVSSSGDDEKLRRNAELIAVAADRAALLTRQLLAFSRRQILQPTVLDLNAVLREMHALLMQVLGSDLELVLQLEDGAGHIEADRSQLDQVILNLALNGRDAMPGGGTLTLGTRTVWLDEEEADAVALPAGPYTTLTVSDNGTGMSDDVRAHAFEPFFTTKKGGDNTGLGLATVHGIVKQSGGEIHLETVTGGGTTFTVYLPRVVAPPELQIADPARRDDSAPSATRTVMVVDDEELVRRFICRTLELHSYTVLEAANGLEAIELWRLRPGEIDVVLTDMVMPTMTGMELIDRLDEEGARAAIVCMSGYAETSILERHTLSSALAYLPKPFTANGLLAKIADVLPEHSEPVRLSAAPMA